MSRPHIILDFGDRDGAAAVIFGIDLACMDARLIDVVTALHHVLIQALIDISPDLPAALSNTDRLTADMKDSLRKRMGELMTDTRDMTDIPDDILDDLLGWVRKDQRKQRQSGKDKWVAAARASFMPSDREACYICRQHIGITHAHHVIPLADQYERGFKQPDNAHAWLCPNHHAIIHLFLSDSSLTAGENFGGLLAGFIHDELEALHELLIKSGGVTPRS